jgi:DNA helicase-2/ATP-dependent DNA helicase PcrA
MAFAQTTSTAAEPEHLVEGLNDAQREAVRLTSGPLAIVAGAGSGKTRVISHRAAYAIETGVVAADRILLVTFTDKSATEMVERMASLGHPRVAARTFHAAALAQLRHFWPSRHDGAPLPKILDSKGLLLYPLARRLPGNYSFTQTKDLATAIEWAKVRRIGPGRWLADGDETVAPIPSDLFARLYADYERSKTRAGLIDFEDMLVETVTLLETDEEAARLVRSRKTWFSVDEYQDTNPLAERLLELWLGDSTDLAVVGDPDQTIYTFTGATPDYLLRFAERHPGARTVALVDNYRSTPQILGLANRLIAPGPRGALRATKPPGPVPSIRRFVDAESELEAVVGGIRGLIGARVEPSEIAVLVRINAQLPEIEQALTRAGIAFVIRGERFFDRREVREARRMLARVRPPGVGRELADAVRALFVERLALGSADAGAAAAARAEPIGDEARERSASLELIIGIVGDLGSAHPDLTIDAVLAELDRREADEAAGSASGVNLLTYHRAKGLEWDAVFLPALEEGLLPIRQAKEDAAIDEERRLLYVGITRARLHVALSWAQRRVGQGGKEVRRTPSRFLIPLQGAGSIVRSSAQSRPGGERSADGLHVVTLPPAGDGASPGDAARSATDQRILEKLQGWRRERAKVDAVPAYVVAHDATLVAIAESRPSSIPALRRIKGMGPQKLERYGPDILAIVTEAG